MRFGWRALVAVVCVVVLSMGVCVFTMLPHPYTAARALLSLPGPGERSVQVVAHPDDDLLFMSPDLFGPVADGGPSVTIFLTAGESVAGLADGHDPHAYAREREAGVRAAYAWLAGVPDSWRSRTIVAGGVPVRLDELDRRPGIGLVFAGLPDGGDPRAYGGRHALTRAWSDGACVRRFGAWTPGCLTRAQVVGMLKALYARFRPTVLRTLDPHPAGQPADHPDHVASARFAAAAATGLPVRTLAYQGYTVTPRPANVTGALRVLKRKVFEIYRRHDYRAHGGGRYHSWIGRMYGWQTR